MENRLGYVYILTNKNNRVLYTGSSGNLLTRSNFHKKSYLNGFTKKYNINKLVYYKVFADIASAHARERQIKGWKRQKKISLIEEMNPKWEDLYNDLKRDPSLPFASLRVVQDEGSVKNTPTPH